MTTHGAVALPDVGPGRAEPLQPGHLGRLVDRAEVEVQAVLHRLQLRHPDEEQVGRDAVLGAPAGGSRTISGDPLEVREGAPPAQGRRPERRDEVGVGAVDVEALPAE